VNINVIEATVVWTKCVFILISFFLATVATVAAWEKSFVQQTLYYTPHTNCAFYNLTILFIYLLVVYLTGNFGNSVRTMPDYRLDDLGSIPGRCNVFFL
jgi:hypothetical protein